MKQKGNFIFQKASNTDDQNLLILLLSVKKVSKKLAGTENVFKIEFGMRAQCSMPTKRLVPVKYQ